MAFIALALITECLWVMALRMGPWSADPSLFLALFGAAFLLYLTACWIARTEHSLGKSAPVVILLSSLIFRATLFLAPPSLSKDIHRYLWDGRVQRAGVNPYRYAPEDPALAFLRDGSYEGISRKNIPTLYPPLSQLAFRSAAALSPTLTGQKACFALFDLALLFLLPFYLRRRGRPLDWIVVYAWNPLVLVEFSSSGHLDSLGLFFLMLGLYLWEGRRPGAAGAAWGLSFLGKFAPLLLAPWMILTRRWKTLMLFLAVTGAGYALFLTPPLTEIAHSPPGAGLWAYAKDRHFNAGLYALLTAFTPFRDVQLKCLLGFGLMFLSVPLARRRRNDPLPQAGILLAAALAASPVVHPWYATWLVPFLCFWPLWSGIYFTGLVGLSYIALNIYAATGQWTLPGWVPALEYGIPAVLLLWGWMRPAGEEPESAPAFRGVKPVVIIPALNEEKALPLVLAALPPGLLQIIVVDNGSTDGTAAAAAAGGAKVIQQTERGYGRAVLSGLRHLPPSCDVVVVMDGGHSDFPEDLPALLAPLQRGEADFVIGSRVLGGAPPGTLTPQQRFGNALACLLIRLLFGRRFTDLGPFRAIRRDLLDKLGMKDPASGWNVEMQIKALAAGARVKEIPVRCRPRIGASKISGTLTGALSAGLKIWGIIFAYGIWGVPDVENAKI